MSRPKLLVLPDVPLDIEDRLDQRDRPRTRGECRMSVRPCPWTSCRHHLFLDVNPSTGAVVSLHGEDPTTMGETCSLDIAERGESTLAEVGVVMGISRERVRQIEDVALRKLRKAQHSLAAPEIVEAMHALEFETSASGVGVDEDGLLVAHWTDEQDGSDA